MDGVGVGILFLFPLGFRPYFHGRNVAVRFREGIPPFTNPPIWQWKTNHLKMYLPPKNGGFSSNRHVEAAPGRSFLGSIFDDDLFLGPQVLVATFLVRGTSGSFLKFQGNIQKFGQQVWPSQVFLSWKNAGNGRQFSFLHLHPCSLTWTENQKKWCSSFSGFHLLFKAIFSGEPCLLALPKTNEFPLRIGRNPKGTFVFRDTKIPPSVQNMVRKAYLTCCFCRGFLTKIRVSLPRRFCFETSAIPRVFAFSKTNWKHFLVLKWDHEWNVEHEGSMYFFRTPLCKHQEKLGCGFRQFLLSPPTLGKCSNLTN